MGDPLTRGARLTHGGPCARRVRHGEPLRVFGRTTSVEVTVYGLFQVGCPVL